ncbi:hypothetical protein KP509_26G033300 [Ceratopteris richardii]|uniref:FLZ-type domain-containing protein n=1 Tax=Ceratopteris richardii TaxID=49495 RepID=A0A8T2RM84_CERRI|nr:hypothetical protein KP509_26G033300 [Ceratopteris richardii]
MLGKRSRPPTGIISKLNFVCAEDRDQDPYNAKASGKPYFSAGRIALGFEIPLHTKPSNACESPRSVLDVGACDSEKHLRGRSLRSCLPAPPLRKVGDQGVGLAIIVKIHADEIGYDVSERHYDNRSQPITIGVNYHIQRQASVHKPSTCAGSSRDASEGDDEDNEYDDNGSEHDDHGDESQRMGDYNLFKSMEIFCSDHPSPLQKDFVHSNNAASTDCAVRPSIFSVASIPSGYDSYNIQDINFLDACANCQRAFAPGKDIFMYRGDQAFCSIQCRAKGSKKLD